MRVCVHVYVRVCETCLSSPFRRTIYRYPKMGLFGTAIPVTQRTPHILLDYHISARQCQQHCTPCLTHTLRSLVVRAGRVKSTLACSMIPKAIILLHTTIHWVFLCGTHTHDERNLLICSRAIYNLHSIGERNDFETSPLQLSSSTNPSIIRQLVFNLQFFPWWD